MLETCQRTNNLVRSLEPCGPNASPLSWHPPLSGYRGFTGYVCLCVCQGEVGGSGTRPCPLVSGGLLVWLADCPRVADLCVVRGGNICRWKGCFRGCIVLIPLIYSLFLSLYTHAENQILSLSDVNPVTKHFLFYLLKAGTHLNVL
jgi:hypothetical protein